VEKEWVFDIPWARDFVAARQAFVGEFLEVVRQQMDLTSAVDVGCGVGDFSKFLSGIGFRVVAVDGREENAREGQRRYPEISFLARNAEDLPVSEMGSFDLVLCFGLLYHLENPFRAVRSLYSLTDKILLVETMCAPGSHPSMELLDEFVSENQGLNYVAFYPTEACLVKMLYKAGFPFVFGFRSLPNHELFHATARQKQRRTMLVASKERLAAPELKLLPEPSRSWDIWSTSLEHWRARLGRLAGLLGRFTSQGSAHNQNARKT
jgi:tRNA (mo5U34)-methyltransferase